MNKINFKQPKYIIPVIVLPVLLFGGYQYGQITKATGSDKPKPQASLSTSLGTVQDSVLSKDQAYDDLYNKTDGRTNLQSLAKEQDSLNSFNDTYTAKQKRKIDSLQEAQRRQASPQRLGNRSYYTSSGQSDSDYQRQQRILQRLNQEASGRSIAHSDYSSQSQQDDPVKTMRKQMMLLDSIEKSKDPQYQAQLAAAKKTRDHKDKWDAFMNSTFLAQKAGLNSVFNTISIQHDNNSIKAIVDANVRGYIGSRIRLRLLEDIYVGKALIPRGTILYAQITGFTEQRVALNVVSIIHDGGLLPVNLSIFDTDGMKGLYVPNSNFRDMTRELGITSVQGQTMQSSSQGFSQSLLSNVFTSASNGIAKLIRSNKAKLKYNTQIYLVNEKELQNENY